LLTTLKSDLMMKYHGCAVRHDKKGMQTMPADTTVCSKAKHRK